MPTFILLENKPTSVPQQVKFQDYFKTLYGSKTGPVLHSTEPVNPVKRVLPHGFVNAAIEAYNNHHHLVLRPDDVWLAIGISFANFVDAHAEQMRKIFVTHEGKIELEVVGGGTIQTANFPSLIQQMSELIEKNTNPIIRQWMEPNFSTTTNKDRLIGNVLLMGAMKNYFTYRMSLRCGLPAVTLEGTLEDWKNIRKGAEKIKEIAASSPSTIASHLTKWYEILTPVLEEFIKTYEGKVDKNFWQSIANYVGGGSGPTYLTGWINVFIPFVDGKFLLDNKQFRNKEMVYGLIDKGEVASGVVQVPVIIDDNGTLYNTLFHAGSFVSSYDEKTNTMAPSFDWVMTDETQTK